MTAKSPFIDRRALFASGAAAALLAATGVSAQSAPKRGGRLRLALSGATRDDVFDWRRLGPFNQSAELGLFMKVAMVGAVFDTLTEVAADGTLRGELATGWQSNADGSRWEFELRRDVTFHDGTPFTSKDVVCSYAFFSKCKLCDVMQVTPLGEHRVLIELSQGDPDLPFRLSAPQMVILPLGQHAQWQDPTQDATMIGTGLYKVRRFEPGRQFIGQRVDSHFKDGRAGWFDSVELVSIPSDVVRAEALRESFVDGADLTHTADLGNMDGITALPEEHFMTAAVDKGVALPAQIGSRWPLDDFRAPQRWWMA